MSTKKIQEIDKNFASVEILENNVVYIDAFQHPFTVYGLSMDEGKGEYCRMAQHSLHRFSESVQHLAWHTAGGRVRFVTDSPFISIKAEIASGEDMSHMPRSGSSGFDMYLGSKENRRYVASAMPSYGITSFEGIAYSKEKGLQEWTIHLPLYNGVRKLLIGIEQGAALERANPYTLENPVVFYGSSITQGGCASRPGNAYPSILSRWLDANIHNLGFSGSAKGEPEMAHYIAGLDMSAFVMDYDHNTPDVEHLAGTHERFFKIIREAKPFLPILLVSKPDFENGIETSCMRREVIYRTYQNAVASGDRHVYFIDGETLFGRENRDSCTVDGCHPNDLGFMRMAEGIYPVLRACL